MIRTQPSRLKMPIDNLLFAATLGLIVFGLLMVLDSSYVKALDDPKMRFDAYYFIKRQTIGAIVGLGFMFTMMRVGYWNLRRLAVPAMFLGIIVLCTVWLPHFGVRENQAARWVAFGPIRFQPSELAKMTLIVYLAALFSRPNAKMRDFSEGLGPPLMVTGLYLLLIEREPDLGTAAVLFFTVITLFFLAGARKRHIALIVGGAVLIVGVFAFGFSHRRDRMLTFLNPEKDKSGIGYQVYHSKLAVGSGGWRGAGWGRGHEKYYLPQANTDFIFATVAEEFGFFWTLPVFALLMAIAWRGFRIASQCKDRFGSLLAAGITSLICWQALINIAVATASIPATGVPLPFVSFGSTSLVLLMGSVGLLLNIAQHPTPPGQVEKNG